MATIFNFKPKAELAAADNLNEFIRLCRNQLTVFGRDLIWDATKWDGVVVFAKLGVTTRKPRPEEVMDDRFIDFAKAYFRYQQGHNSTESKNEGKALRAIEAALIQVTGSASISGLSITVLDEAAQLGKLHYSAGSSYACGREIERLATFVTEKKLIANDIQDWRNPIRRHEDTVKTGAKAKIEREKKLPGNAELDAMAEIFANNPVEERDIFTSSVFALLLSAPSRISEVLALPVDCEVTEIDKDGNERYGLRFFAGKGYEGDIKWIPTVMVSIAKEAIQRISKLSENARKLSRWIENNPGKFYRHENCPDVADDTLLTMEQACQALGLSSKSSKICNTGLRQSNLKPMNGIHTLNSLWQHVTDRLPEDFPWFDKDKGIKFSNALFALNKYQFHRNRTRSPIALHKPTNNFFNNDLSPRESLDSDFHRSIFDRNGYQGENGKQLKLTSHQARHLLNTIAQRGGLGQLEIAKWSGRANVKQNRTYNHMTEYELVSMAEQIDTSKALFGPTGEPTKHLPVSIQEFNTLETGAVHVTEFGYCVHDYTMSPCEKFRDCLNCTEQVCIKGNEENFTRIKERLARTEALLEKSKIAVNDGDVGADRWFQYQNKIVARLRELIRVLENTDIEDGAQIKLRGDDFSQLRRVINKKSTEAIKNDDRSAEMLNEITMLLGGGLG